MIAPVIMTLHGLGGRQSQLVQGLLRFSLRRSADRLMGFIEQGETPEECAAREVKEETNITVKNIKYVASQSWPFPDQLMIAFTAEYDSGEIKIQEDELVDAQWFSMENLPSLPNEGSVAYNLIHKWRN